MSQEFPKFIFMKICSPINSKTWAELLYTGQNRPIPKATCNKKIQYKDNLLDIKKFMKLVTSTEIFYQPGSVERKAKVGWQEPAG